MANDKYVARLQQKYVDEVAPALFKKYGYASVMQVPALEKVVINIGVGEATSNSKMLEDAARTRFNYRSKTSNYEKLKNPSQVSNFVKVNLLVVK